MSVEKRYRAVIEALRNPAAAEPEGAPMSGWVNAGSVLALAWPKHYHAAGTEPKRRNVFRVRVILAMMVSEGIIELAVGTCGFEGCTLVHPFVRRVAGGALVPAKRERTPFRRAFKAVDFTPAR